MIICFGLMFFSLKLHSQADSNAFDQKKVLTRSDSLTNRYGKVLAAKMMDGMVEIGFTPAMVYHAKGKPYLIEKPYGEKMDFEIFYYPELIVFIDFGKVAYTRKPGGAGPNESDRWRL